MKSYSQSYQDCFAMLVNDHKPGFFLDLGCSVPHWRSNSKLLLENNWEGVCVDIEDHSKEWNQYPKVTFLKEDASKVLFTTELYVNPDYCSIDADQYSYLVLKNIFSQEIRPRCLTIEHDFYRFGESLRKPQREMLDKFGYRRVMADIKHDGFEYEDWYVRDDVNNWVDIQLKVCDWHTKGSATLV